MNNNPHIAITGGIGCGKSYVCGLLAQHGIKVYDCDSAAKRLMATDEALQKALCQVAGEDVFVDGILQKPVLAKYILASESNKQAVNNVVHPAVAADFMGSDYTWLESAILFEARFDERVAFDYIVCVTAPEDVRIERIMKRDNITQQQARLWISRQMPQEEMARRADFVILNDGLSDLSESIESLLQTIEDNCWRKKTIIK